MSFQKTELRGLRCNRFQLRGGDNWKIRHPLGPLCFSLRRLALGILCI